jgi:hypothetical protein
MRCLGRCNTISSGVCINVCVRKKSLKGRLVPRQAVWFFLCEDAGIDKARKGVHRKKVRNIILLDSPWLGDDGLGWDPSKA